MCQLCRTSPLSILLLAIALVLSSCGADAATQASYSEDAASDTAYYGDSDAGQESEPEIDAVSEVERADGDSASAVTTGSVGAQSSVSPSDFGREIIFTANLELGASDVSAATAEAIRTIEGLGGFVFRQDSRGGFEPSSTLVFKVLPTQFQTALDRLGSIGDVRSQSVSAEDVSAIVVDLQSRISTAQASVERLRALLEDASISELATIEGQLMERETTLERLRGQLRTVRDQVDLATITVTVVKVEQRAGISLDLYSYDGHDGGFGCYEPRSVYRTDKGDPVTFCSLVRNVGHTTVAHIELEHSGLGDGNDEPIIVDGSIDELETGEQVIVAYEVDLEDQVRVTAKAMANSIDGEGDDEIVMAQAPPHRIQVDSSGLPSFGDALAGSWNALKYLVQALALVAVSLLPWLVFIVGAIFVLRRWRKSQAEAKSQKHGNRPTTQPSSPPSSDQVTRPTVEKPDRVAPAVAADPEASATPRDGADREDSSEGGTESKQT